MSEPFPVLLEHYLAGTLDEDGAAALLVAVEHDPALRDELLVQAALSRRIGATVRAPAGEDTWNRIALVMRRSSPSQRRNTAQAVAQRITFRRRRLSGNGIAALLALAATLAVVIGGWWLMRGDTAGATLSDLHGEVAYERGGRPLALMVGTVLCDGDVVRSARAATARLRFPDGTTIALGAESSLTLDAASGPGGKRLTLTHGRIDAEVAHQPPGRPLQVRTAVAVAEVVGTRLRLQVDAVSTRLEVDEGAVVLRNSAGAMALVTAGQFAVAAPSIALVAQPLPQPQPSPAAPTVAVGQWEDITPSEFRFRADGYGVLDVLADPIHPGTCYAFVDRQGMWRSTDWGSTWSHVSSDGHLERGRPWSAAIAPDGSYLLACTEGNRRPGGGAWKSSDGGRTWRTVAIAGDDEEAHSIAIDPADARHVIASVPQAGERIYESRDAGQTWEQRTPSGAGRSCYLFFITSTTWLAVGQWGENGGTRRTTDAGASWTQVGPMEHFTGQEQIAIDPDTREIYVPAQTGIYRSRDGGATFSNVSSVSASTVFATTSRLYALYGWASSTGVTPTLQRATRGDGQDWTPLALPPRMSNGAKRVATLRDPATGRWVIVSGNWNAGIWRFIEPMTSESTPRK